MLQKHPYQEFLGADQCIKVADNKWFHDHQFNLESRPCKLKIDRDRLINHVISTKFRNEILSNTAIHTE